jgi:hypothetical protein
MRREDAEGQAMMFGIKAPPPPKRIVPPPPKPLPENRPLPLSPIRDLPGQQRFVPDEDWMLRPEAVAGRDWLVKLLSTKDPASMDAVARIAEHAIRMKLGEWRKLWNEKDAYEGSVEREIKAIDLKVSAAHLRLREFTDSIPMNHVFLSINPWFTMAKVVEESRWEIVYDVRNPKPVRW